MAENAGTAGGNYYRLQNEEHASRNSLQSLQSLPNTTLRHHLTNSSHLSQDEWREIKRIHTTELSVFINIVKAYLGGGILAIPFSLYCAGTVGGIVGLLVISFMSNYTLKLIIRCKEEIKKRQEQPFLNSPDADALDALKYYTIDYQDIATWAFGRKGYYIASCALVISNLGVVIGYLVFVSNTMESVLRSDSTSIPLTDDIEINLLPYLLSPVLLFFSYKSSPKLEALISLAGNLSILLVCIVVSGTAIKSMPTDGWQKLFDGGTVDRMTGILFRWKELPSFFGLTAFSFIIHGVILPIESSLLSANDESTSRIRQDRFTHVPMYLRPRILNLINFATVFVTIVCILLALIVLAGYEDDIKSSMLDNLDAGGLGDAMRVMASVSLLATIPLFYSAVFNVLEEGYHSPKRKRMHFLRDTHSNYFDTTKVTSSEQDSIRDRPYLLSPISVAAMPVVEVEEEDDELLAEEPLFDLEGAASSNLPVDEDDYDDTSCYPTRAKKRNLAEELRSFDLLGSAGKNDSRHRLRLSVVFTTIVTASLLASLFGEVIALIGAFSMSIIAYLLPTAMHLRLCAHSMSPVMMAVDSCIFLFGLLIITIGSFESIQDIARFFSSGENHMCEK